MTAGHGIMRRMAEAVEFKSNGHNASGYLARPLDEKLAARIWPDVVAFLKGGLPV